MTTQEKIDAIKELRLKYDELLSDRNYWETRCLSAEKFISKSPCDPDIYDEQISAFNEWGKSKIKP